MSMSVSAKKSTSMTNIKHNNRNLSEKEMKKNTHIDTERSTENKYLVQKDLKELYKDEFGEALEKYNEKQKRSDRKIDNYYNHIDSGKKTSVQQEMIFQVGDKDDFSSEENKQIANDVLKDYCNEFQERNPNLKVYNAVIHNDEASPHLHLNFVPVAGNYKRGLEKQVSFDRAITQQDPNLDKVRPFQDWRDKEVSILAEKLQERGIERKLVGTNDYKDVNDFKEKKDLEKEINELKTEKIKLLEEKEELKKEVATYKEPKKILEQVEETKKVKGFGKSVLLPTEKYDLLKNLALSAVKVKENFDNLFEKFTKFKKDVTDEFETLELRLEKANESTDFYKERADLHEKEVIEYGNDNMALEKMVKTYKRNEIVYKSVLKDMGRESDITTLEKKGSFSY